MQTLITSFLLQNKECTLPGIGDLRVINTGASTDANNNLLLPPFEEIIFRPGADSASPALIHYIAAKNNIAEEEAQKRLQEFCRDWKEKIAAREKLVLETIGSIHNNADGNLVFERERSYQYLQPVAIHSPYHKKDSVDTEAVNALVAVDEVSPANNNLIESLGEQGVHKEMVEDVIVERSYWGLWALILFAIAAVMLFYHFKDHAFTGSSSGNQNHLPVDSAKAAYTTQ